MDSKQRTLTFFSYVEGGFALSPKIRIKDIGGQSLIRLTFTELPVAMQNRILDYELSISLLRPLKENERATVFSCVTRWLR